MYFSDHRPSYIRIIALVSTSFQLKLIVSQYRYSKELKVFKQILTRIQAY